MSGDSLVDLSYLTNQLEFTQNQINPINLEITGS